MRSPLLRSALTVPQADRIYLRQWICPPDPCASGCSPRSVGVGSSPSDYASEVSQVGCTLSRPKGIGVNSADAAAMTRKIARTEGVLVGISSGAAATAAFRVAKRDESKGKNIVVILPDSGERYLSTWIFEE